MQRRSHGLPNDDDRACGVVRDMADRPTARIAIHTPAARAHDDSRRSGAGSDESLAEAVIAGATLDRCHEAEGVDGGQLIVNETLGPTHELVTDELRDPDDMVGAVPCRDDHDPESLGLRGSHGRLKSATRRLRSINCHDDGPLVFTGSTANDCDRTAGVGGHAPAS